MIVEESEGRKRGRKSSLARKRVRDKIGSNELSGPDMSLMRTAEIILGRDRNARAHATTYDTRGFVVLSQLGGRTLLPVTGEAGGLLACHPFVFSRHSRDARAVVVFVLSVRTTVVTHPASQVI